MNDRIVKGRDLTANEWRVVELLRSIRENGGHGELRVEVRGGIEVLFDPTRRELPPERPSARC